MWERYFTRDSDVERFFSMGGLVERSFLFFSFYPKFDDAKTQNFPLCILLLKLLFCFFFFGLSISIDRILVVVDRFLF